MKNFKERAEKANKILDNISDDEFAARICKIDNEKATKMSNIVWKKENHFTDDINVCENCKFFDYKVVSMKDDDGKLPICTLMPDKEHNSIDATNSSCDKFEQIWFKVNTDE